LEELSVPLVTPADIITQPPANIAVAPVTFPNDGNELSVSEPVTVAVHGGVEHELLVLRVELQPLVMYFWVKGLVLGGGYCASGTGVPSSPLNIWLAQRTSSGGYSVSLYGLLLVPDSVADAT
jgi:hypothetical protein